MNKILLLKKIDKLSNKKETNTIIGYKNAISKLGDFSTSSINKLINEYNFKKPSTRIVFRRRINFLNKTFKLKKYFECKNAFKKLQIYCKKVEKVDYTVINTLPSLNEVHNFNKFLIQRGDIELSYVINIILNTGLRLSEFKSISLSDLNKANENNSYIYYYSNKVKTYRRVSVIYSSIKEYRMFFNLKPNYLKNFNPRLFTLKFKRRIDRYNKITNSFISLTPHKLRHLHATTLLSSGSIDIATLSKRLGHSNINTTCKYYINSQFNTENLKVFNI